MTQTRRFIIDKVRPEGEGLAVVHFVVQVVKAGALERVFEGSERDFAAQLIRPCGLFPGCGCSNQQMTGACWRK